MYFPIIDALKESFIAKIPSIVTKWLTDNVNPVGSAVVVDESLSISGAAADAKITGDKLNDLKSEIRQLDENVMPNLFAMSGTFENIDFTTATQTWSISKNRIAFRNPLYAEKDVVLNVNLGYRFIVFYFDANGNYAYSNSGWKTERYTIASGSYYCVEMANVNNAINIQPSEAVNLYELSLAYTLDNMKAYANENKHESFLVELNPVYLEGIAVKTHIETPPDTTRTYTILHQGKNLVNTTSSASIAADKNGDTYFATSIGMKKGERYTISYIQDVDLLSATQNCIKVAIGGNNYLFPKTLKGGKIVNSFIAPVDGSANVALYCYTLSSAINISNFQIEHGSQTEYAQPKTKSVTITVTPETKVVEIDELNPYKGEVNTLYFPPSVGYLEVDAVENAKIERADRTKWELACGKIACIGDSLTDGLYAPIPVGLIAQNYPYYLGRLLNAEIDNLGKNGSYPSDIYASVYPDHDFRGNDSVIIWLGTNGGLFNDFTEGTQADYYTKIIDGILAQKSDIQIFLCTVFATGGIQSSQPFASVEETNATINYIASLYGLPVIDMYDLSAGSARILHNSQNNVHFGKAGYLYIANRIANFMHDYYSGDITRVEFGIMSKP